jgi:hypothetical protein
VRRTISRLSVAPMAVALATVLLTAGCGDVALEAKDGQKQPEKAASASPAADTSAGEGNWLLAMTVAGGEDAEASTTVYLSYNPSTGQATPRQLPAVKGANSSPDQAALLVSADRAWAIPDTGISRAEGRSGELKVYSLTGGSDKVVDIRERTGQDDVEAIGWAFDPQRSDTLRVVDTKNRVWAVEVAGGKATQESKLPNGPWVFLNGFNRNTGEPYMESIDTDLTKPAGQGAADTSPVTRDGGAVLPAGSPSFSQLPASPCRLGAGFADGKGTTWAFCADDATVVTYYLPKDGKEWTAYGKPSSPVAPTAAGFPLVLPPAVS